MTSQGKVFISYSSKDKAFVRRLVSDLKAESVPVWLDKVELKVGDSLRQSIGRGIEQSSGLLVILSHNSANSPWVQQELNAAFALELSQQKVFILPAIIDNCEIPPFLKDKVYADFRTSYDTGLSALLDRFGDDTLSRGRMIYSSRSADSLPGEWTLYYTGGDIHEAIKSVISNSERQGFYLQSFGCEDVGLCLSIRCLYGSATFYYRLISGDPSLQNVFFAMIPMQENGPTRTGYIEVGSNIQDDPQNTTSHYRRRYFVPEEHYVSTQWHLGTLEFDFRDTPTAFYAIFAPRINEGCTTKGSAKFLLGDVAVYTRE